MISETGHDGSGLVQNSWRDDAGSLSNLQAELFHARATLNQLHSEFNLECNDERVTSDDLDKTIARAADALADMDEVISRPVDEMGRTPVDVLPISIQGFKFR